MKYVTIDNYITKIINESLDRKKLAKTGENEKKFQTSITEDDDDSESLKTGNVDLEDIVERLNSIRSGKSFKDEGISSQLRGWFDELEKAEKTALLAFLKGIDQVVSGVVDSDDVLSPSETPSSVKMKKKIAPASQKVTVKPNVIVKDSDNEQKSQKKPKEDITPPIKAT